VSLLLYFTLRAVRGQSAARAARENSDERSLEGAVERGVDDRVDYGRRVAEPQERLEDALVDVARLADAHDEVDDEERRPAGDERREHHPDDAHRLPLGPHHRSSRVRRPGGVRRTPSGTARCPAPRHGQRAGQLVRRHGRLERRHGLDVGGRRHGRYRDVTVRVRWHLQCGGQSSVSIRI